jgi:ribonuclease P protein component
VPAALPILDWSAPVLLAARAAFPVSSGDLSVGKMAVDRIRVRRDFLAANSGVRVPMPGFVLLVKPAGHPVPRVGFTVSRKVGNAVVRNRARRRLRELARELLPVHGVPGADHVFIARTRDPEVPFDQLRAEVAQALGKARRRLEKRP